ncbi:MAG: hypothetical protein ACOC3T_02545 [Bacteroidota bacterium]
MEWARGMGSTSFNSDVEAHVAVDSKGNVYAISSFHGTYDFDPGPGVAELTCDGDACGYIVKYNNAGDFQWVKIIGGTSSGVNLITMSIAVDQNDSVIYTGTSQDLSWFIHKRAGWTRTNDP